MDRITFWLLIVGALAWGWFARDVSVLDLVLEKVRGPLDEVVFVLIGIAGRPHTPPAT